MSWKGKYQVPRPTMSGSLSLTAFMTNLLMGVRLFRVTLRYWLANIRSVLVETSADLDILG